MNTLKKYEFYLENLDCANCANKIQYKFTENKFYYNVVVNFNTLKLSFETEDDIEVDVEEVIKKRSSSIYKADGDMKFKESGENKGVAKVYKELFKGDHDLIHELLHYIHVDYEK